MTDVQPSAEPAAPVRKPRTWAIREGTRADREAILTCRRACFAGEELEKQDTAYWDWEFVDNHAGPARHFVAAEGDRVVGWYAVIPQRFAFDGESLPGSIVVDVMTHPDYRFQGMFTALGRAAIEGCTPDPGFAFTTGYPIRPEVLPGHFKVGWKARFEIGIYAMPLSVGALVRAKAPRLGPLAGLLGALPTALFRSNARARSNADGAYRVDVLDRCDADRFGPFWETMRSRLPSDCVVQERTPAFLTWRYDRNPGRSYRYYVATDPTGAMCGYLITRSLKFEGVQAVVVADALALPSCRDAAFHTLFAAVRRDALRAGSAVLAMAVTQPNPLFPAPRSLGFVRLPARFTFITREYGAGCPVIERDPSWHLMYGDTDDI